MRTIRFFLILLAFVEVTVEFAKNQLKETLVVLVLVEKRHILNRLHHLALDHILGYEQVRTLKHFSAIKLGICDSFHAAPCLSILVLDQKFSVSDRP